MNARLLAGLATGAVLTAGLAACGGGDEEEAATPPCGFTTQRTERLTLETAPDALAEATDRRMTVRFRQELTIGERTASVEGVSDASPDELFGLDETLPGADGPLRVIVVDGKTWVSAEEAGTFYLVDPEDPSDPLAGPVAAYDSAGSPADATAGWEAGLLEVRYVGEEVLDDGAATELYEFDVNPQVAARASGEEVPRGLPPVVTSYVWVDAWNLVHKVRTDTGDEVRTEYFSDYCEPVDIKAPDDADVVAR